MISIILLIVGSVLIVAMIDAMKRLTAASELTALIMMKLYQERK
jgi:hypothetical protein